MSPMGLWQNSTPFFGAAAFCTTKIYDFRAPLKSVPSPSLHKVVLVQKCLNHKLLSDSILKVWLKMSLTQLACITMQYTSRVHCTTAIIIISLRYYTWDPRWRNEYIFSEITSDLGFLGHFLGSMVKYFFHIDSTQKLGHSWRGAWFVKAYRSHKGCGNAGGIRPSYKDCGNAG